MNIVKGVADLIRRTSSGQTGDSVSGSQAHKLYSPGPKIRFSEVGDDALLNTLWEAYDRAVDKGEKRRLFHVFLKQFLVVFKNWEPVNFGTRSETASTSFQTSEYSCQSADLVVGCSAGHPAEIILILTEEVKQLTVLVTELNTNSVYSDNFLGASTILNITSEGLPVLDALTIITRSLHNCKTFGFYGGIQKLTALMKGAVVQLKTINGASSSSESSPNVFVEMSRLLQQILLYVVSIVRRFIELDSIACEDALLYSDTVSFVSGSNTSPFDPAISFKVPSHEGRLQWHQKAVVSVMESGGLNWLVELLRVFRRLNTKVQRTDIMLQCMTLRILCCALSENPRGQNHFKSIGGLEVLLDGLGLPSNNAISNVKGSVGSDQNRDEYAFVKVLQLHVLSLEVLREAVYGNLNNLQFLCENGRIHKFANSFCSTSFMLQECKQQDMDLSEKRDSESSILDSKNEDYVKKQREWHSIALPSNSSCPLAWKDYVLKLCTVLCSFLLTPEDSKSLQIQASSSPMSMPLSSMYSELSIKWIMRVLQTIFPCIRAFSSQNELPSSIWVFVNALQHSVLTAFRKILVSSPISIEVFQEEGIWDLFFSENFFYFGPTSEEFSGECCTCTEESPGKPIVHYTAAYGEAKVNGVDILQIEVISFLEFAATSHGSSHNLPEVSALLDAFEQSSCNSEVSSAIAKGLLRILQLSTEKTLSSFKTTNAVSRVLKVACIQAQEYRRSDNVKPSPEINNLEIVLSQSLFKSEPRETAHSWLKCMETSMELFSGVFSVGDDAKSMVLHDSTCIDLIFDLFWEGSLRNNVLTHILELMKILPFSEEDQKAKLLLCSKYLETFTQIKEREKNFTELSIDLLVGIREMLLIDPLYYQTLFRDGECFLHIVSLLNGTVDEANGEKLVLNVLQTLTCLLSSNDVSKAAFRALAGKGYRTLQSLLLDFCQWHSSEGLLSSLLDMLLDGNFDIKSYPIIQNEDVIIVYLSVLQKSSDSQQYHGLGVFQQLLRDSISNRASCVRAGMLNFLLDWFSQENDDGVILKIAQLIQVIGGHSISGMEIRKIFALLRSEKVGTRQQYCSLLLSSILSMLNEKGPTAFFDISGNDSGIKIKKPMQWPLNKGFSFSCWLRIENFPRTGAMGLFSFLSETGRGSLSVLVKDKLIYESINLKRQCVQLPVNLVKKKWHFLCITHSIGRAFSGGSLLRCYVDGDLISSERCRYAKVNEPLTSCTVGAKISSSFDEEDLTQEKIKDVFPFLGQIGPVYFFSDALSSEQVQSIYSLGPNYMYAFLDDDVTRFSDSPFPNGIFNAKDGLASKVMFGLNAQASNGKALFNVSSMPDPILDNNCFEAMVMAGTELCSRRLLQQIIYCVGGVSVLFPLIAQSDRYEYETIGERGQAMVTPITKESLAAEVIKLIASVLDENLANQQQMHLLSGFSILGFLLQSVPPQQLNLDMLSALKHLFNVVASSGAAELLVKDAISGIFLNPFIWVYSGYMVQRELYMFLIQQFDNDPRLLKSLCRLPFVLDIIHRFYWESVKSKFSFGSKPLLHPISKEVIGERPSKEEIRKIRLLLLSLGEMSLRQNIAATDIKALISFFETNQDVTCIEDVLHMVIRAVTQMPLLASFLEQVNLIGGCQIFVNLLQRDFEPIRLLSLQFLGRLLVGLPSEKKGPRFFNLSGRSRSLSEGSKSISLRTQPIFSAISNRLFRFPQTDNLRATLFDILLGGASPKQVLQKQSQIDRQRSKAHSCQFFLPQVLVLIFRFLSGCEDDSARLQIMMDLLDLLETNPSNIEAFVEYGWNAWLIASTNLDALKDYKVESESRHPGGNEVNERSLAAKLFCVVLSYYVHSVRGGWQQLEETANFLLMNCEQGTMCYWYFLRDIYEDLIRRLVDSSSVENIFGSQPCRDNSLYLLKLVDEMLLTEIDDRLPFPASGSDCSLDSLDLEYHKDYRSALQEVLHGETDDCISRIPRHRMENEGDELDEKWWYLYDDLWVIISEISGKGPSKTLSKPSLSGPSLGQRARGLVESLNIPAAEVAAVVVSGGMGSALTGKPNKNVDKAMLLRGERFPSVIIRLVILYLCRSSLERASRCVQQVISLLPCLVAVDDEQNRNRLQLFIWSLLTVRSQYGMLNDGARFHVISHLIVETVTCSKQMLATSIMSRDEPLEAGSVLKETGSIQNLIQKDRVLAAIADEAKYIRASKSDRTRLLHELGTRLEESASADSSSQQDFEDEIHSSLNSILVSDDSRRFEFQLTSEEEQQNIAEKWIHMLRALIDERGPWSTNHFPNIAATHWKLDKTEDMWRRRLKLRKNYHFDEKLCNPPSTGLSIDFGSVNEGSPSFVGHIPEQMKRFFLKGVRKITDEGNAEPNENDREQNEDKASVIKDHSDNLCADLVKDSGDRKDIVQDRSSSSSSLESEASEVLMSVPCVLVTLKRKLAGHLAVMKNVLHFFGEFLVEGTGGSSVFKNFKALKNADLTKADKKQNSLRWPMYVELDSEKGSGADNVVVVEGDDQIRLNRIKRHRRWNIGKVKAVHWTRYLLRYTAIEIFFTDSVAPIFFNFASKKDAKAIGTLIVSARNDYLFPKGTSRSQTGVISFVDRRVALEMAETARESWRRRDITNFEYLIILNTLAGRSYNDLTQYPVFPWVLADYSSEVLDFNKSSTFRDLSKPVGALDLKRFEVFEDRYRNFCDPDIPSFYYGSHYSSMGIVLYYLLRLEPFTSLHRNLQGGKFDHADRLFQSIEGTYRNCLSNTSDVKELIPEFFYMPEFLVNSNSYHLGVKQDGDLIGDVGLPPWAKGSPEEFISRNREALESEYVSSNIHHWIDLVFGYKQHGKPAVEAANIFYYLTYEGAVDLDTMEDELLRSAIEDQIANFGQTPIQIFRKKHPRRGPPIPIAHPLYFAPASINLTSIVSNATCPPSAIIYVGIVDSHIVLVSQGFILSIKMWLTTQLQSGGNFTFSGSQDPSFGVGVEILSPRKIGSPLAEYFELGAQCFATLQTPSEKFLVSCGNWENSFQIISLTDGRMVQNVRQHKDVVCCVAVTSDGSILATGSYDTTVMVWEVVCAKTPEKRVRGTQTELASKDYVIIETPFHILCGHDDIITCLYVSVELDIVISGSKDGTCIFHTLREGRYVRSLCHPSGSALSKLVASPHGRVLFYADDDLSLHLYSINGKHLAASESNGRLNCLELSPCGDFLVCAGDHGQIVVRSMSSLEVIRRYNGVGKTITSLTVTAEECFLAGTKDGSLLVYSIENPQLRRASLSRNVKSKAW